MKIMLKELIASIDDMEAGQRILLSGEIYTARDSAHKRIISMLENSQAIPFELKNSAIYYCGPTPAKPGNIVGACGPTTSSRMDIFTPKILDEGAKVLIGKGARADYVIDSIKKNKALYLTATGGIAALLSKSVIKSEIIAFEDLGPEAIYKFEVKDMPLIITIDGKGKNLFQKGYGNVSCN